MADPVITGPAAGAKITINNGKLSVPNNPIIPFIEGDGRGRDIWRASVRVFDAAVEKCYGRSREIHWLEVYAGEKSNVRLMRLSKPWKLRLEISALPMILPV